MSNCLQKNIDKWRKICINIDEDLETCKKLRAELSKLIYEIDKLVYIIDLQEYVLKSDTGGYTSQELFEKIETDTGFTYEFKDPDDLKAKMMIYDKL